ncbi:uncharacterized protein LOC125668877 [Ostrea edulis]|uniref:uncharacterized protein LOC125668877 n=1 Tax=Ostrea edulis TaxID=37623 RepID=UPI0024AF5605|nr:uncharacterized protein LOC125668877 [Ostrea edulis]
MMKTGIEEDQVRFVMESDCVLQYMKIEQSPTAYYTEASPTSFTFGNNEKFMILKIGHAAIQCDILEIYAEGSRTITKNVFEHLLMWDDKNPEKRVFALFPHQFKFLTLNDVKRDYRKLHSELLASLEKLKKNTDETKSIQIELPQKLMTTAHYRPQQSSSGIVISPKTKTLSIDSEIIKNILEGIFQITNIFLSATCTNDRMIGVRSVCLIGGYANNDKIRDIVKEYFRDVPVILPQQPDRIVVMGATLCPAQENVPYKLSILGQLNKKS